MLDIKQIRQQPDWFKEKLATRGVQPEEIDAVLEHQGLRRTGGSKRQGPL